MRGNGLLQHTLNESATLDLLDPRVPVVVGSCRNGNFEPLVLVPKISAGPASIAKKKVPPQFRPILRADIQVMRHPRSSRPRVGGLPVLLFERLTPLDPLVAVVRVFKIEQAGHDAGEHLIAGHDNVDVHDRLGQEIRHGSAAYVLNPQTATEWTTEPGSS
jgi:hypothetical protein